MVIKQMAVFTELYGKEETVFNIGELIIYGTTGVCKVTDIGCLKAPGIPKDRIYYTLEPCRSTGSKIFTPVDNEKVIMRNVIDSEEAIALIDEMQDAGNLWVMDEKRREFNYKEAVRKCDCRELVKIIKAIYLRKQSRIAEGKKVTAVDEKYFHIAEDNLYEELAVSLEMDRDEIREFITDRVKKMEELKTEENCN